MDLNVKPVKHGHEIADFVVTRSGQHQTL